MLRIMIGTTVAALALSYRNQLNFATQRGGYSLWQGLVFPLLTDSFVVVGELLLFSAAQRGARGWHGFRIKAWGWLLALGGLAASAAAGVMHVGWAAPWPMKLAAAVAPLAAAASLGTGLGIVKRNAARKDGSRQNQASQPDPAQRPARQSRARQPGLPGEPVTAAELAQYAADQAAGLPVGKVAYSKRHSGISEHRAMLIGKAHRAASNGGLS